MSFSHVFTFILFVFFCTITPIAFPRHRDVCAATSEPLKDYKNATDTQRWLSACDYFTYPATFRFDSDDADFIVNLITELVEKRRIELVKGMFKFKSFIFIFF